MEYFVTNGFMGSFMVSSRDGHDDITQVDHSSQIGEQGWVSTIVLPVEWSTVLTLFHLSNLKAELISAEYELSRWVLE